MRKAHPYGVQGRRPIAPKYNSIKRKEERSYSQVG